MMVLPSLVRFLIISVIRVVITWDRTSVDGLPRAMMVGDAYIQMEEVLMAAPSYTHKWGDDWEGGMIVDGTLGCIGKSVEVTITG